MLEPKQAIENPSYPIPTTIKVELHWRLSTSVRECLGIRDCFQRLRTCGNTGRVRGYRSGSRRRLGSCKVIMLSHMQSGLVGLMA